MHLVKIKYIIIKEVILLTALVLFYGRDVNGQEKNFNQVNAVVNQWIEKKFAKNTIPPFSFIYNGKHSDTFIKNWDFTERERTPANPNSNESVYTYSDKHSGLVVRCLITAYNDFPAVEWTLKFSNRSDNKTPIIENVNAIDHIFNSNKTGTFILHHAKGCTTERSDFQPFTNKLEIGKSVYMTPDGGRSSGGNLAFPFFNIESPANEGIMVAIGWTGKWYADIQQKDDKSVALKSGMERMQLFLYPQEEIRTPRICLFFWKGEDRMTGHNQFRRFVLAHHTRTIDGKPSRLPMSAFLSRGGPSPCNEFTCLTENYALATIERFKQFGIVPEVFWVDAGWYFCDGDWHNVGTWVPDKVRFPHGLKPISDAVHQAGAKFLLWFEPERVTEGSWIYEEHPEWVSEIPTESMKLFKLGDVDARNWLTEHVSGMIKSEGIDIYRQDFNMNPYPHWVDMDLPQRTGIAEIRHIEGLYAFWDSLLVRFPNLLIDNCASGGRRIDLETISRSSPLWRTDYPGYEYPNGSQDNTYGLNFYLPLHGTANFFTDKYFFRSNLSSSLVLSWNINGTNCSQEEMQSYMKDFKRLRPYYYSDFYPLTGLSSLLRDNSWLAYQLDRPEKGDGIILAFRRDASKDESIQIQLRGLDKTADYEIFYEDYGIRISYSGAELMKGIPVVISTKPSSLLISYKRL